MYKSTRGVTLIELLIVVTVIAILASIAIPSYRNYVLRTQRTEGMSALLRIRAAQEKYILQNNVYCCTIAGHSMAGAPPNGLGIEPTTQSTFYTLAIETPDPDGSAISFRATATAAGAQLKDTSCRTFTVNDQGVRTAKNVGGSDNTTVCWK